MQHCNDHTKAYDQTTVMGKIQICGCDGQLSVVYSQVVPRSTWLHVVWCVSKRFSMAPQQLHTRSHIQPCSKCSCFPKKVFLRLSSEQSVGDVRIMQLDWKRVPQARSWDCKSSVAITAECWRHHASQNASWPQRAPSAVGHETAVVGKGRGRKGVTYQAMTTSFLLTYSEWARRKSS